MNHASKTNRIVPSLFTTTQILKGQPMKTSIADRSPQSLKGILLLALALIFLSTAPARADLVWTVTSVDADETAVLTITTDGTSHTVDGTYNLLSIDKVEYCSGGGCTPVTVIDWDDEFGAEPPPFYQILGAGPIQVTGSVPSLLGEIGASDPPGANVARSGVVGSQNAVAIGGDPSYSFLPTDIWVEAVIPPVIPPDLNPGDQYRLMFVTDSVTDAESTDIAVYNAVVAGDAAAVAKLAELSATWTAMAWTPTVSGWDNTGTDPTPAGATGVPIYLVDNTRLADNYDMLWVWDGAGPLLAPPNVTASGGSPPSYRVWTGANGLTLGGTVGGNNSVCGIPDETNGGYLSANDTDQSVVFPLYGLSSVLTVPYDVENITQGTTHSTIQDALDTAANGDVIELGPYTYYEDNITFPNGIDVTLRGAGRDLTIIDGGGAANPSNPILKLVSSGQTSATQISDLTLRNGVAGGLSGAGGALLITNTSPTFRNAAFRDNTTAENTGSGHAFLDGASANPLFDRCVFSGAFATTEGMALNGASAAMTQCLVADNAVTRALRIDGTGVLNITNCTISEPGAVSSIASVVNIFNSVIDVTLQTPSGGVINTTRCLYAGATGDNIDGLPTFEDAGAGDYRLAAGSLGIDAADYGAYITAGGGAEDLSGDPRTHDDTCTTDTGSGALTYLDMGAYERQTSDTDSDGVPDDCDVLNGCNDWANLYPDDIINLRDFSVLAADFGCTSGCVGDIDGDNDTDLVDLAIITANWLCTGI